MWKFVFLLGLLGEPAGAQTRIERCEIYGQIANGLVEDLANITQDLMAQNTVMQLLAEIRPEDSYKATAKISQDQFDRNVIKLTELGHGINDGLQQLVKECSNNE